MDVAGGRNVRTIFLLAFVPVSLIILSVAFWMLPPGLITPFYSWLLIEAVLGLAFLGSYHLARKYHLAREVPFIIAGLFITLLVVLSYVTIEVQRLAFALTAIASCVMYYRLGVEFKRRKYA
jgi:hypothetical protein